MQDILTISLIRNFCIARKNISPNMLNIYIYLYQTAGNFNTEDEYDQSYLMS